MLTGTSKLCKAALAEFREAAKAGYHNQAGIHIMATLCLTKLQKWAQAVKEIKLALGLIPPGAVWTQAMLSLLEIRTSF